MRLADELAMMNEMDELPISVIRVWPNFPDDFSFLSMEAEIDDGGTIIRIDERGSEWEARVSRWIFGDCWDTYRLGADATLLGAWQRVYEMLHQLETPPIMDSLPDWVVWDDDELDDELEYI